MQQSDDLFLIQPRNETILHHILPNDIFSHLKKDVEQNLGEKYNDRLVGSIKGEYGFTPSKLVNDHILDTAWRYFVIDKKFPEEINRTITPEFTGVWVNKQLKHEYNSIHNHSSDMSFVIWVKIPFDLEEESKVYPDKNIDNSGDFVINYRTFTSKPCNMPLGVDKNWEGTMIMFPGDMLHFVNPFYTSDEYRISVAGNVVYKVDGFSFKEVYGQWYE